MTDQVYIKNRKASFDYFFVRDLVAGIQLTGSEVKQIRKGKVSLADSFCHFENDELYVKGMNITQSDEAFTHEALRNRKLLLKKQELKKLKKDLDEGMTIVVKKLFTSERGFIKVEISLAKGKKNFDKRASIKDREIKRSLREI
jgi:SsrA-binding protein